MGTRGRFSHIALVALAMALLAGGYSLIAGAAVNGVRQITVVGSVPDAPSTMRVYHTATLTAGELSSVVDDFSMGAATVETDTATTLRRFEGTKELTIEKRTGVFEYFDWSISGTTVTLSLATDTAVQISDAYLNARGLLDSYTYLRRTGPTVDQKGDQEWVREINLNYGKKIFDGTTTQTAVGAGAKTFVVVGKGDQVGTVMQNMPKLQLVTTAPTISGAEAVKRLKAIPRNWVEIATRPDETIINTVTVAYYVPNSRKPQYIEPAYVFEGTVSDGTTTSTFYQVISALDKTKINDLRPFPPLLGDIGGVVRHGSRRAQAAFAPGTFSGSLNVTIDETQAALGTPGGGLISYGNLYDFNADSSIPTTTLSLGTNTGYDPAKADVYTWNGASWDKIDTNKVVDQAHQRVDVAVGHFSIYGLFGPPPATGLNKNVVLLLAIVFLALGFVLLAGRFPRRWRAIFSAFIVSILVLNLSLAAQVMAANEAFSSGISTFDEDHGCWEERDAADMHDDIVGATAARGFTEQLVGDGFTVTTAYGNNAAAYHWEEATDGAYVEENDIAFINTHGWEDGRGFIFNWDGGSNNCDVLYTEAPGWGGAANSGFNNDLEVVALKTCQTLRTGAVDRWGDATFDGLHQLLGFSTNSYSSSEFGEYFANYMERWASPKTVWEAWKATGVQTQAGSDDVRAAMIFVDSPSSAYAKNDYLTGHGSQAADNTSPTDSQLTWTRSLVN